MFEKVFRKNKNIDNPESHGEVSQSVLTDLNERLAQIDAEIAALHQSITDSFLAKTKNLQHDGNHNILADDAMMRIQKLEKDRAEIMQRIQHVSARLATLALRNLE